MKNYKVENAPLNTEKSFSDDGVIVLKNVIPDKYINDVREEYDILDISLDNAEIVKDKPLIIFWKHVIGETKRITTFDQFPTLWRLIEEVIVPVLREQLPSKSAKLQLLETIIFNKPAKISNTLNWHQDVAYFPLKPNNQIAVWLPFENITKEKGAMHYALGSHKAGIRGSVNLHTKEKFDNEDRELIPDNPEDAGFQVKVMEMTENDMIIHDGYTWHYSGPNEVEGYNRRGLSVRFIIEEARFDPRPGQGAAFTKQIEVKEGEVVKGKPFPDL
jgi:ectoine hydroxylase-related dioxygenase (phytanoyl-CoA dioxygenase family)